MSNTLRCDPPGERFRSPLLRGVGPGTTDRSDRAGEAGRDRPCSPSGGPGAGAEIPGTPCFRNPEWVVSNAEYRKLVAACPGW